MKKSLLILLFTTLLFSIANAQQNNNWYFGRRAALSFNVVQGQPIPFELANSNMDADEAAASISDENGNLLFYTNGITVYNKNHQVMQNGDNLDGSLSATQIAIIPKPGSINLFYIFTTGSVETSFTEGYRYSIVDMTGDNGNGTVTSKNILLWPSSTERMATVRHSNGIDTWLITNDYNSNVFRSWLITCNGIEAPQISTTGIVMDQYISTNSGVLKASPDGQLLCQTHFPSFDEIGYVPNFVQLFDFNTTSGIISNPKKISFPDAQFTHCAFSPDSKQLYLTRPSDKKIDQLDVSQPTLAGILASRISISTTRGFYGIELAPDEKIYVAQPSLSIAAIHQPNVHGTGCSFQEGAVILLGGSCYIGLPSQINDVVSYDNPDNGFVYTITDSCSGNVEFHAHTTLGGTITWAWDFGDGATSSLQNPVHIFNPPGGQYMVRLKITSSLSCGTILKSKIIRPQGIIPEDVNFDFIRKCDSGYVRFTNTSTSLGNPGIQFSWDFGDGILSTENNPIHYYAVPGIYTVKLSMLTGASCLDKLISKTVDAQTFTITASADQTILVGQQVSLSVSGPAAIYSWSPVDGLSNPQIKNPVSTPLEDIVYTVSAVDDNGCTAVDSVKIKVIQYDDIFVPNGFTPGNDGKNDLLRPFYPGTITLKEFSIFNRWGQLVFSTSQRSAGWDGKINGIFQEAGVYVWILKATGKKGDLILRKGSFVLIK